MMTKFDLILDLIFNARDYAVIDWQEETREDFGCIVFYSHKTNKRYRLLWDNDDIYEFEEVS